MTHNNTSCKFYSEFLIRKKNNRIILAVMMSIIVMHEYNERCNSVSDNDNGDHDDDGDDSNADEDDGDSGHDVIMTTITIP